MKADIQLLLGCCADQITAVNLVWTCLRSGRIGMLHSFAFLSDMLHSGCQQWVSAVGVSSNHYKQGFFDTETAPDKLIDISE